MIRQGIVFSSPEEQAYCDAAVLFVSAVLTQDKSLMENDGKLMLQACVNIETAHPGTAYKVMGLLRHARQRIMGELKLDK